ncbi:MAG: hypothetical protein GKR98_11530 [Boseongicola sp.]|nr:MAG: hypothetical protein GKR98_11530 [Boseongicola sp.]
MPDRFIALIPSDPKARPASDTMEALRIALAARFESSESRVKDFGERLQFIDCGENYERTLCPSCEAEVPLVWWGQRMDGDWDEEHGFHLHRHEMPCCGASHRLTELEYRGAQGFAHWFVSARVDEGVIFTSKDLQALENEAGLALKLIEQRY